MTQKDTAPAANDPASTQTNSTDRNSEGYPEAETIAGWAVAALEDLKGIDIRVLDVRGLCNFAYFMVFSSGTSDRHLKSQANSVVEQLKAHGIRPMGVEGDDVPNTEWVLVDAIDVLVHIMLPETRDHYQLEKLWSAQSSQASGQVSGQASNKAVTAADAPAAYATAIDKIRASSRPK
ncbi:MAG: ribosome silencing factor [Halothiobacillus sp. 15-55-196]|jgi:ribosome-associated protein|uniref:ribosome silencing factor n=1 Tax=Halothiobacillus sp. 15-55-196 TaxID=1970382 RepID=UPI000BD56A93|nr:ribosome silencing factor [Halothiobacillus sp. 15-55-196]OZB37407.1 MAG: ribosome silencing factor [Halothiobacillus sp. 15-55-196]